jgi:hypothetical protein
MRVVTDHPIIGRRKQIPMIAKSMVIDIFMIIYLLKKGLELPGQPGRKGQRREFILSPGI